LLRPRLATVLLLTVVFLVGALAGLVTPWTLGRLVDQAAAGTLTSGNVWMLGSLVLVSGVLAAASTGYGTVIAGRLFETVLAELREDLVAQAFRLPQGLVEEAGTGDLVSRTSDDVTQVSDAAPRIIPAVTGAGFTILVTLLGTAALHWSFALVLLLLVPLYVVTLRWYLRTAPAVYAAERAAAAERAHHLLAALRGAGTVHAFRAERVHLDRISHASWEMVRWTMRARTVQNMFFGRLNLAEFVGVALRSSTDMSASARRRPPCSCSCDCSIPSASCSWSSTTHSRPRLPSPASSGCGTPGRRPHDPLPPAPLPRTRGT
jgi:ATP-binding cassette subfamily C protein